MPILSRIEGPRDLKGLSYEQLAELAQDCRDVIISTITKTGGHLASNLGVVELTLALHRAFDSPKDNLVWDTSNQCYTHKLVTGRYFLARVLPETSSRLAKLKAGAELMMALPAEAF